MHLAAHRIRCAACDEKLSQAACGLQSFYFRCYETLLRGRALLGYGGRDLLRWARLCAALVAWLLPSHTSVSVVHHWCGAVLDEHMPVETTCSRFAVIIPTLEAACEPLLASIGGCGVCAYLPYGLPTAARSSKFYDFSVHARKCSKST